jgi:hypothetical protein
MSVNLLLNDTPTKEWSKLFINHLHCYNGSEIEGDLTVTGTINGTIPVLIPGLSGQFLRTNILATGLEWHTFDLDNVPHGSNKQVLKTVQTGPSFQVQWDKLDADSLNPGLSNQILVTNSGATDAHWSDDLNLPGDAIIQQTLTSNGNITGNANLQIQGSTVLHSNAQCDQNLVVNGNILVPNGNISLTNLVNGIVFANGIDASGSSVFNVVNITGDLQMGNNSGSVGQYLVKDSPSTQQWTTLSVAPTNITNGANLTVLRSRGGSVLWDTPNLDILPSGTSGRFLKTFGGSNSWQSLAVTDLPAGLNNQVLTTVGGVPTWSSPTSNQSLMRFYQNTVSDVNLGSNIFINATQQYDVGTPFTLQSLTGTFFCNQTGIYRFTFSTEFSTHDAQTKLLFSNGTDILYSKNSDYVAGLVTVQPFSATAMLQANFGEVWAIGCVSVGVGGTINNSGVDLTYNCPTTILEIELVY